MQCLIVMRAALVTVMLTGAAGATLACPQFDFDDVAAGGPIVATIGEGLGKIDIRAVPSRPSFYFHHGEDDRRLTPTFTEDDGTPIAVAVVYTGIPEYPIRYDLAITSGTVVDTQYGRVRFEVSPGMAPHTREVRAGRRYDKLEIAIDTDAALLQFDVGGETWTTSCRQRMTQYFDSEDIRITAIYANRTEEVIYGPAAPPPRAPSDHRGRNALLALLGVLGLVAGRRASGDPGCRAT